jgi:hypothetical protein
MVRSPQVGAESSSQWLISSTRVIPRRTTAGPPGHPTDSLFVVPPHIGVCCQQWIRYTRVTPHRISPGPPGEHHRRRSLGFRATKGALPHPVSENHFRIHSNGIYSIPNFIQIHPAVLELNHADRQAEGSTDRQRELTSPVCSLHALHAKNA